MLIKEEQDWKQREKKKGKYLRIVQLKLTKK